MKCLCWSTTEPNPSCKIHGKNYAIMRTLVAGVEFVVYFIAQLLRMTWGFITSLIHRVLIGKEGE